MYTGEIISLIVAVSWTITAICFEYAGKRIGALTLNIVRLLMAIVMLAVSLKLTTGHIAPWDAGQDAWMWLILSGAVGYVFGDFCLFNSYLLIGSRFGQLFMTLAPPTAAIAGYVFLGEKMGTYAVIGMLVCILGIGFSIIGKSEGNSHKVGIQLPLKGVLYGIGAGMGQGLGLVLSKIGMNCYLDYNPPATSLEEFMLPFEATQIRAFAGVVGFLIILHCRGEIRKLISSFSDKSAMVTSASGTFFGPFVGVSLSLMAVQYTNAGVASTLMALTPIIILLPSKLIFKEVITFRQVLGAVISVAGVALFFV